MPQILLALGRLVFEEALGIELLKARRGDNADLIVANAVRPRGVADRVDMQPRRGGLAGKLAQSLDQLLLELVRDVILLAEEDDTAL